MPLGSALAAGGWLAAVVASSDGNALLAPGFAQPALLNDQPLPLTFSPKRFLLVANNDNASSAVLACIEGLALTSTDAVVRFNRPADATLGWFGGQTHISIVRNVPAQRAAASYADLDRWERLAPTALHVVMYDTFGNASEARLPQRIRGSTPTPDGFFVARAGEIAARAPELGGAAPSTGLAAVLLLHAAHPHAEVVTAGFDFHAADRPQSAGEVVIGDNGVPRRMGHSFGAEREAAARMPWVRAVCEA